MRATAQFDIGRLIVLLRGFECALLGIGIILGVGFRAFAAELPVLSLAGSWRYQLDPGDVGTDERWFTRELPGTVQLPGSLPAQGIGNEISANTVWTGQIVDRSWFTAPEYARYREPGKVKVPFWLQPDKYYAGAAWYQRDLDVPADWAGNRVALTLERPHWDTRVWIDAKLAGTNLSLSAPHHFDLGTVAPGKHTLTVRVDNRMVIDVGENSHSVSDHTQGNWNGIVGRIELQATPPVWIEDVQVFPNVAKRSIRVVVTSTNASGQLFEGKLSLFFTANDQPTRLPVSRNFKTAAADLTTEDEVELPPETPLWDEFTPQLLVVQAELRGALGGQPIENTRRTRFGLREITTAGTQFLINGRKTFLRGTLECAIFPKTGHPPTDVDSWRKVIHAAKAHGLNLIRFHSWCPPEAAFIAADELGFYFHVEAASWANGSTTLGDGKPVDRWIYDETDRILKAYGNHPSFVLMLYGNEPGGKNHAQYLARWMEHFRARDSRRLYSSGAGWPEISQNEFHVTPTPRIQAWGAGLKSRINARPPETLTDYRDFIRARPVPVISHEIGQWCVYPNFDEIPKYTGYLKPKNLEIFRDSLNAHRMGDLARKFLLASGKLQTLCYKEEIESALRTPGMGGFELLDLHDFPGQGTALVGVLDSFWEPKGYVTAREYRRFCDSTVPLARLAKRVFTTEETLEAALEVAHFGRAPLNHARTSWKLVDDSGTTVVAGTLPPRDVPVDNGIQLGKLAFDLKTAPAPARYRLIVGISEVVDPSGSRSANQTLQMENDWDVWVYPAQTETTVPNGITVARELNEKALAALNSGGTVLLLIPPNRVAADSRLGKVALGFSSIFWNTAWTHRQPPHTLGILCDPKHPLFAEFPTDDHSNWQWWYLISRAGAMILDSLPNELRPTVQVIDDWVSNRRLGLFFEAKLGRGQLAVCSIDLEQDLETNIVARQFRHSLLRYLSSDRFRPNVEITTEQARQLSLPAHGGRE